MNLADILGNIIEIEGDYVDHPSDRGGPTRYGITESTARAYGYTGSMKTLPRVLAVDIYIQRYWTEPQFDRVAFLSEAIARELLDTGINMGQTVGVKFLQRALNVLNKQGTYYPDVTVDGVIGSMTLFALAEFLKRRGKEGEMVLLNMMNSLQSVRYIELAEKRASQEDFMYGWQKERAA